MKRQPKNCNCVVNVVSMASASHASTKANVYPAKFQITGLPMNFNAPMSIGAPLAVQGLIALIGRDVLQHCTLNYNGHLGQISLCIQGHFRRVKPLGEIRGSAPAPKAFGAVLPPHRVRWPASAVNWQDGAWPHRLYQCW
jgi:hypothetical protein